MSKTVTVLVPVYNMGKYLRQCFDSILAQTYKDFILLAVDDGSTDDSPAICDEYREKDSRVQVIHTENQGQDMARNTGLDNIHTDYIAMIDADDCVNCHFLEILMATMEKTGSDMVYGFAKNYLDDNEVNIFDDVPDWEENIETVSSEEMLTRLCKHYDAGIPVPHKLYKAKTFDGVRYPPVRVNIDEWTTHHLILNCDKISYVKSRIYYYRNSPEGMTRNFSLKKISGVFAMLDRIETLKKSGHEELVPYVYKMFYEKSEIFYWNCKRHDLELPKKFFTLKPQIRKAYNIVISKQTDTYSGKERLAKKMFGYNFKLYEVLSKKFNLVK